jgi:Tfp pilus assembly protein PilZ
MSRAVRDAFRDILGNPSLRGTELATALQEAGVRHGIDPYRACLQELSAAPRDEDEARRTIDAIEAHRDGLRGALQRDPGLAVAAADYLRVQEGHAWRTALLLSRRAQAADPREGGLDAILSNELRRSERLGRPLALALLAPEGGPLRDEPSRAAGAALREAARSVDRVVRLLPEGYAIVLPCTPAEEAVRAAARLRRVAERATDLVWSAGIAAVPGVRPEAQALAAAARASLSLARRLGGGAVSQGSEDRRRSLRRRVGTDIVTAWLTTGGRSRRADLCELSLSGAFVRSSQEMRAGARVVLTVRETTARARVASVPSRVVRVLPARGGERPACWGAALAFEGRGTSLRPMLELIAALPGVARGAAGG